MSSEAVPDTEPAILRNDVIKERWKVIDSIGQASSSLGGFGEVFRVLDTKTSRERAMKVEYLPAKKPVLKMEVAVLRELLNEECVPKFVACGKMLRYNFLVMSLVGQSLSELRKEQDAQRFPMYIACQLGIQMLEAIRCVHDHGVLHRDIKPSNFAVGLPPYDNRVFILDFGLSRIYRSPTGGVRPPRASAGFRGTSRYASLNTHNGMDMARRDDLWSFFYVMVESIRGYLPWKKLRDKAEVRDAKLACNHMDLVDKFPKEFKAILLHIQALTYDDDPDYEYLIRLLRTVVLARVSPEEVGSFPWQSNEVVEAPSVSPQRSGSPLKVLTLQPQLPSLPDFERQRADDDDLESKDQCERSYSKGVVAEMPAPSASSAPPDNASLPPSTTNSNLGTKIHSPQQYSVSSLPKQGYHGNNRASASVGEQPSPSTDVQPRAPIMHTATTDPQDVVLSHEPTLVDLFGNKGILREASVEAFETAFLDPVPMPRFALD